MLGMNGMTGMGGMGRNAMNRSRGGIGVQQSVRPVIQISNELVPAWTPPVISQLATTSLLNNQFLAAGMQQMQVNVDTNGFATVRGTANTNRERTMAAAMLSLEPGVRGVRNEIVIPAQPSLPASR